MKKHHYIVVVKPDTEERRRINFSRHLQSIMHLQNVGQGAYEVVVRKLEGEEAESAMAPCDLEEFRQRGVK